MTQLKHLDLSGTPISNAGLKHLQRLTNVKDILCAELAEDNEVLNGEPMWKDEIFPAFAYVELARMGILAPGNFEWREVITLPEAVARTLEAAAAELEKAKADGPVQS